MMDRMGTDADPEPRDDGVRGDGDSLAPAVTRAALILDVLAQAAGEPMGPSELARRLGLPKSSIANVCGALAEAGLRAPGRHRLHPGPPPRRARRRVPRDRRPGPGVLRRGPAAPDRLRGDRPARGPRRPRGHLPRAPRRAPARAPHLGHRSPAPGLLDRDRQGRARVARRRRPDGPARGDHDIPAADPQGAWLDRRAAGRHRRDPSSRLRDGRRGDDGGRRLLRRRHPQPPDRRRSVGRQHHAPQGAGHRRAGTRPDRRPPLARRTSSRTRRGVTLRAGRRPPRSRRRPPLAPPRTARP